MGYLGFAKDVFNDFLTFMRSDWKTGIEVVFELFLIGVEATMKSAVEFAIAGGKGIWKAVSEGIGTEKYTGYKYEQASTPGGLSTAVKKTPISLDDWNKEQATKSKAFMDSIIVEPMKAIRETWQQAGIDAKETIKSIAPDLAKSLKESQETLTARLAAIGKPSAVPLIVSNALTTPKIDVTNKDSVRNSPGNPSGYMLESNTLKYAPGSSMNYQKNTADNTKMLLKMTGDVIRAIKESTNAGKTDSTPILLQETRFA